MLATVFRCAWLYVRGRAAFLNSPRRSSPGCRSLRSATSVVLIGLPLPFSAELICIPLFETAELRQAIVVARLLTRSNVFEADMFRALDSF